MLISHVTLRNFRNHADSALAFGEGVNVLVGDNGQGKTNVLEAIAYLSLTKSFYATSDAVAVQFDAPGFELQGRFLDGHGREHHVRACYEAVTREKIFEVNRARPERLSSVIGEFPVVVLSPEHAPITAGGPSERRRFLDLILSQVSRVYLEDVLEYRRVLRQRNRLLAEARTAGTAVPVGIMEPWTLSLARLGARVIERRRQFVEEFRPMVLATYRRIAPGAESPELRYVGTGGADGGESAERIEAGLLEELRRRQDLERRRGMTMVGPHRDDLELCLNGRGVQAFASQGQHKTLLVALKVAECSYMRERTGENPLVLLDDLFGELDRNRSRTIIEVVDALGQCVVTAVDEAVFRGAISWNDRHRKFEVERGACRYAAAAGGGS